jgi:hypothetical protein
MLTAGDDVGRAWHEFYFRGRTGCFRSRTPGPPPFSSMNSTPAASSARCTAKSFAAVIPVASERGIAQCGFTASQPCIVTDVRLCRGVDKQVYRASSRGLTAHLSLLCVPARVGQRRDGHMTVRDKDSTCAMVAARTRDAEAGRYTPHLIWRIDLVLQGGAYRRGSVIGERDRPREG